MKRLIPLLLVLTLMLTACNSTTPGGSPNETSSPPPAAETTTPAPTPDPSPDPSPDPVDLDDPKDPEDGYLLNKYTFDDEAAHGELFAPRNPVPVSIEWVNGFGRNDDTALKCVHVEGETYTSAENAVRLTLPEPLPAGGVYRVVAWCYAATDENPGKGTLTGPGFVLNDSYSGNQGEVKFPENFGTLPMDEWKEVNVTLPVADEPITTIDFRLVINDADKHPDVWYWDDIEIYQVGELEGVIAWDPSQPFTKGKNGVHDDFDYSLWSQKAGQDVSMLLTGGGTFECSWNQAFNVLFRMGKLLGSTKTHEEFGVMSLEYAADYNPKGTSYLCMYGWTQEPLVEFYVVDAYTYNPGGNGSLLGTVFIDGGDYDIYECIRVNQPSIEGDKTFPQYFSVRKEQRTEGTISITEHFKVWKALGLEMGKMYEVTLCVEGYNSSGSAKITEHVLTLGDTTYG